MNHLSTKHTLYKMEKFYSYSIRHLQPFDADKSRWIWCQGKYGSVEWSLLRFNFLFVKDSNFLKCTCAHLENSGDRKVTKRLCQKKIDSNFFALDFSEDGYILKIKWTVHYMQTYLSARTRLKFFWKSAMAGC